MKTLLPRLSPSARIAIGLLSLIITLLLIVDIGLNLVPDKTDMQRQIRESNSERLAVQLTSLIQSEHWDALKVTMNDARARDPSILSLAVRQQNGKVLVKTGDHVRLWSPPSPGKSTLTHVRVPIHAQNAHWGDVEISYTPVAPQTLGDWLSLPPVAISLVIVPVGFLAFYLYIRRTLQYLDPSAAIPDRVRVAFDALTEGVAIVDKTGRIMLFNRAFGNLHPHASADMIGKPLSDQHWLRSRDDTPSRPWEQVLQEQASVDSPLFSISQPDHSDLKVVVNAAPIQDVRGKLRGCMVTFYDVTELHHANDQMRSALAALEASRAQIEIKNEELTRLATRDPLTDCLNRRAFFEAAEPMFLKLRQEARNMSCIMFDIDFFKRVNDNYGHQVGDKVIVAVAQALTPHLRANDLLCRYGGEEFCILLPGAPEEAAVEVAERLRREIQQRVGEDIPLGTRLHVTGSFGVSSLKSGAESVSELIELADFALYSSKQNGRNRVTLWQDNLVQEQETQTTASA